MRNTMFKKQLKAMFQSRPAVFAVFIAAVAAVLYLPTLSANFVYDDLSQIIIDDYIHKPARFAEVLSLSVMGKDILDNNRPVMLMSLMVDSLLWGRNPFGYHLTNLLLHILCSIMAFLLFYGIVGRLFPQSNKNIGALWGAFAGALLFAIHPVNSEAVCVVTFREDLLVAFFTLLVLILAERFPTRRKTTSVLLGGLMVILIFAAAAAKENGVITPVLLLIYWLIVRRHSQWRIWAKLIAAGFAGTVVFAVARFVLVPAQSAIFSVKASYLGGSFSKTLAVQPRIWVFQLLEFIWPKLLCADQTGYSVRNITLSVALVALAAVIVVVLLVTRKNIGFGMGALFYCLAILPTSNLVPIYRPMADRYLYFPMVWGCLALGTVICRLKVPKKRSVSVLRGVAALAICIFFGTFTVQRVLVWQNSLSLWEDTIKKNPLSYTGWDNLGFALFDAGEFEKAVFCFQKATQLEPGDADPYAGLAITYDAMKMPAPAEAAFGKAVSLDKYYASYDSLMKTLSWESRHAQKLAIIADRILEKQKSEVKKELETR